MNIKQIQLAIMLSETRNFSQLAEKLKITQPALSKQILTLEQELGVKLFDRSTLPLTLTPAGEHFIREAKEIMFRENQLIQSMEDYKSGARGRLVIGISPFRSLYLIPDIVSKVRDRFPGIQISLHETNSEQLRKEAAEGKYDFAIINLPVDESVLDVKPLEPDTLVLSVPKKMAQHLSFDKNVILPEIELKDCKDFPFIVVSTSQELRRLFDKLCAASDFHPNIIMEVVGITTAWAMSCAGIGATILPFQFADNVAWRNDTVLFKLKGSVSYRQPAIVTKRGQYLSEYARFAIESLSASGSADCVPQDQ